MGRATASATTVVISVPVTNGRIPKRGASNNGVQSVSVRKSTTETWLKKVAEVAVRASSRYW